ncbi:hypothetical protein JYT25_00170 [bacterium AH-315-C20]|nr:hypothetical protein [bacterium AH-315-C20]
MKKIVYSIVVAAIGLTACKKNDPIPGPTPDAADLINFISGNVSDKIQNFTVSANSPIYIVGNEGVILSLPANQLEDAGGTLISGNVDIELIEITKKSAMLLLDKPTRGKMANGDHELLISRGEYYVTIKQFGTEVVLISPMHVTAPAAFDGTMRKFVDVGTGDELLWDMADDSIIVADSTGSGFDILPDEWGWTNIDRFYSDPRPKTTIFADLPDGFDNTNTEVYLSYDGEGPALANFDKWDSNQNMFTEHYGLIPIGLDVHFIAIAIVDDDLHYCIESVSITDNHVQDISDFAVTTEAQLINLIDNLP